MERKRRIIAVNGLLFALLTACFVACGMIVFEENSPEKETITSKMLNQLLTVTHYNQLQMDDEFSQKAFESIIDHFDPNKRFFLKSDLEKLGQYRSQLDEFYPNGDLTFFEALFPIVVEREKEVIEMVEKLVEKPFEFKEGEKFQVDADSIDYCGSSKELKRRWSQYLQYMINDKVYQLVKKQSLDSAAEIKPMIELEQEARSSIAKRHREWFDRMEKLERADHFATYINGIMSVYCPHTTYLPPKDKEDFDIEFSGKLEGIGATLSVKEGYIHVEKIVPGSASWKAGELKAGDVILEVGQADGEPVDVYDMRLDKAVRLIRGPKGTEVRLTIKKVTGEINVISIVRDVVILEETYAKSVIIKSKAADQAFGYLNLESFYADFNNRNGRNCAKDVLKELKALKKSGVSGLILDLRNNGGGSLTDAIDMAGYFIRTGPIVQVDGVNEAPKTYADYNPLVQFDLPLVVMVNEYSASASEIFAAAMQDYHRGVIIGTGTYGKGTVQRFYPLDQVAKAYNIEIKEGSLGEVKETIAKFFRVNGGATQLRGVTPDIILPDNYMYLDMGEASYPYALPWKEIAPATYDTISRSYNYQGVIQNAQGRIDTSSYFNKVKESAKYVKWNSEQTTLPLYYEDYARYKEMKDEKAKAVEAKSDSIVDWSISFHVENLAQFETDTIAKDRMEKFRRSITRDQYIREALRVVEEMQ